MNTDDKGNLVEFSRLDKPAMPSPHFEDDELQGLTKREQACLTMGVADSGDAELDAIIEQGNKQRLAGLAMQGLLSASLGEFPRQKSLTIIAEESIIAANVIFKAVKR